jgi:hypothetical protein
MPIRAGSNKKGLFYRWGTRGTKYYFDPYSKRSVKAAYNKALKQGVAISISKRRKK